MFDSPKNLELNIMRISLVFWIPCIRLDAPTIHNIVSPRYRGFEAQYISLIDKSKDTNYEHELIKRTTLRSIHKPVIKQENVKLFIQSNGDSLKILLCHGPIQYV